MLTTSIGLIQKYDYLEDKFKKGYEFLRNTDLKALPLGRVDIDGDEVFASVQEYTTMPADACRYESHDLYFDIQYVVARSSSATQSGQGWKRKRLIMKRMISCSLRNRSRAAPFF